MSQALDIDLLSVCMPVAVGRSREVDCVEWMHAEGIGWHAPFFDDAIRAHRGRRETFITPLDALAGSEHVPAFLMFHLGRCGSTLLTHLLREPGRLRILNEPSPLNALLQAHTDPRLVRALVSRLCAGGAGGAERTGLKLTSWNLLFLDVLSELFPASPKYLVIREPAAIERSYSRSPAGWSEAGVDLRHHLSDLVQTAARPPLAWDAVVAYERIPEAAQRIRRKIDLPLLPASRMNEVLGLDAKAPHRAFQPADDTNGSESDWVPSEWSTLAEWGRHAV